jgi:hypothetical protein
MFQHFSVDKHRRMGHDWTDVVHDVVTRGVSEMTQDTVSIRVEVDRKTDAILREWARMDERSKRALVRVIVRRRACWWRKQMEKRGGSAA